MKLNAWIVPKLWEGQTAAILATGPSLQSSDVQAVRERTRTVAVNDAYRLAPWADVLYGCDLRWWHFHWRHVYQLQSLKVMLAHKDLPPAGVLTLENGGREGFDSRPTHIRTGQNSGFQAMHLAAHLGAKNILLLGFDMHERRGSHFFGDHPPQIKVSSPYQDFISYFNASAAQFKLRGFNIVNCTPGSALRCFPMMTVEEAIARFCPDQASA